MCGICGIITTSFLAKADMTLFEELLYMSAFRGLDATGVFTVQKKNQTDWKKVSVYYKKDLVPSSFFIDEHSQKDGILEKETWKSRVFVGHCRAATKGALTLGNAHPFDFQNLIGVHNGTINIDFNHSEEYETDSEAIFRNINDYGIDEALQNIQSYTGAYTLVWYDKVKRTLNFIRNDQRPLFLTYFDSKKSLMFASEETFLEFVAKRHNVKVEGWGKDVKNIFTLKENHLLSIPVDGISDLSRNNVEYREIKVKKVFPVSTYSYRGKYGGTPSGYKGQVFNKKSKKWEPLYDSRDNEEKFSNLEDYYKVFNNLFVNETIFKQKLSSGCAWCGCLEEFDGGKAEDKIYWLDHDRYVCSTCKEDENLKGYLV